MHKQQLLTLKYGGKLITLVPSVNGSGSWVAKSPLYPLIDSLGLSSVTVVPEARSMVLGNADDSSRAVCWLFSERMEVIGAEPDTNDQPDVKKDKGPPVAAENYPLVVARFDRSEWIDVKKYGGFDIGCRPHGPGDLPSNTFLDMLETRALFYRIAYAFKKGQDGILGIANDDLSSVKTSRAIMIPADCTKGPFVINPIGFSTSLGTSQYVAKKWTLFAEGSIEVIVDPSTRYAYLPHKVVEKLYRRLPGAVWDVKHGYIFPAGPPSDPDNPSSGPAILPEELRTLRLSFPQSEVITIPAQHTVYAAIPGLFERTSGEQMYKSSIQSNKFSGGKNILGAPLSWTYLTILHYRRNHHSNTEPKHVKPLLEIRRYSQAEA